MQILYPLRPARDRRGESNSHPWFVDSQGGRRCQEGTEEINIPNVGKLVIQT